MTRLAEMADLRGATMPAAMSGYASALSSFSMQAIDEACKGLERSQVAEYESRWPELGRMLNLCREEQQRKTPTAHRFFCEDCASDCGMLFFDSPRGGRRLRGRELVGQKLYARKCPCGGTETDWRTLEQDRAANPDRYFTLADVYKTALTGVRR